MLEYNPFDPDFLADPYPVYRQLRDDSPVHRSPLGFWVLARYEDVQAVQRDRRFGLAGPAAMERLPVSPRPGSLVADVVSAYRMLTDPAAHRRFRSITSKILSPRRMETLRPLVLRRTRTLISRLKHDAEADLIAGYAAPLTLGVVCEWLGVPPEDWDRCRAWSASLNRVLQPSLRPADYLEAFQAFRAAREYFAQQVTARQRRPANDLLSALAAAETDGGHDAPAIACVLLGATYETTTNLIGNGLRALLDHPDQMSELLQPADRTDQSVSELLRFDSPVQLHGRTALTDVEVRGAKIPAGDKLILLIGAANRDPRAYSRPDHLDLRRSETHGLSFGGGAHHCLGEAVARTTAGIAIARLLADLPVRRRSGDRLRWRTDQPAIRGLRELIVTIPG